MKMDQLKKFNRILSGKYLFHFHTSHTDGRNSVQEYLEFSDRNGYETIIFSEHVRQNLSYDFEEFLKEIKTHSRDVQKLNILIGVEARILPEGRLDLPPDIMECVDVVCIACHSFPRDSRLYFETMVRVFQQEWVNKIRIWVHPGLFFLKNRHLINEDDWGIRWGELVQKANDCMVFGEKNMKYQLPGVISASTTFKYNILGQDAHGIDEIIVSTGGQSHAAIPGIQDKEKADAESIE